MSDKATVQEAIAAVMSELPNIGKRDKSPEGYAYRGIEAVTKHVQPLFAKHGVVVAPSAEITDVRPSPAMKEGWTDVFIRVSWTITGPDGSVITAQTTGIGRDRADKGANKAQTQAFKYLLLHLLCIADGKDDSDNHSYEQDRQEPPKPLSGWTSLDEQKEAHDAFKSRVSEASVEVQEHMRDWRKTHDLPWPMSAGEFSDLDAELARVLVNGLVPA